MFPRTLKPVLREIVTLAMTPVFDTKELLHAIRGAGQPIMADGPDVHKKQTWNVAANLPWYKASNVDLANVLQQPGGHGGDRLDGAGTWRPRHPDVDNGQMPAPFDRPSAGWTSLRGSVALQPTPELICRVRVFSLCAATHNDRDLPPEETEIAVLEEGHGLHRGHSNGDPHRRLKCSLSQLA